MRTYLKILLVGILCLSVLLLIFVYNKSSDITIKSKELRDLIIGKEITINISDTVIDGEKLQNISECETNDSELSKFNMMNEDAMSALIKYLNDKCYIIEPGNYTFNQSWHFENGHFILNNGNKIEVFKYKSK